ncbi:MAG: helicase-exonuclease AddAB subunit AddA [Clostridia bacterium]
MRLTEAQHQAVYADNRELLVSAAAGSGKTAVLVERILRLILQRGLSISRMLVVTFTRAAAAELRERLELRLMEAAQENPKLMKEAELVANAKISTIHSYCQHVVRQNFEHCGIDPQFRLSDERAREKLYSQSLEETLNELYENALQNEELAALTHKFKEREIVEMLDTLYRFLMSRPNPMAWLDQYAKKNWCLDKVDGEQMAVDFCTEAMLTLVGVDSIWSDSEKLAQNPVFPEKYRKTLALDGQIITELKEACENGFSKLLECLPHVKFSTLPRVTPEDETQSKLAEDFKNNRDRYKDMLKELQKLLPADLEQGVRDMQSMQPAAQGIAMLLRSFHENFSARKREQTVLDFNDLEHMALEVLSREELRKQEADSFDAIFVDEYQDVSALQEGILNSLKREPSAEPPQYIFYVGDVKQSIYRFRLAEPKLFLKKLQSFSSDENAPQRRIILNRNFRSRTGVLNAVNRVFGHVMDKRVTEIDYDVDAMLYPGAPSIEDPQTELQIFNSFHQTSADLVLAQAEWIANDIQKTVGETVLDAEGKPSGVLHYRDVVILLPVSKNISNRVESVLTAAGVPVYCENGADSLASDEMIQVLSHLKLIDNLMDDVALIAELRSPIFEMTERELAQIRLHKPQREASFLEAMRETAQCEDEPQLARRCSQALQALEQERFLYNSMSPDEYLWDFMGRSGLYVHYGAQPGGKLRQANLRMLCDKAGDYAKTQSGGLRGFLEGFDPKSEAASSGSPTVLNPWEDVVRIMTIHKSKGLEFPTVYLMGLGSPLKRRANSKLLTVHGELGFGLQYVHEKARTKRGTLLQAAITLREQSEDRAERARLLYVAMTRPKNRLVMLGTLSEKNSNYDSVTRALDAGYDNSGDIFMVSSAKSMLEWLLQCVSAQDIVEEWAHDEFSTEGMRNIHLKTDLTTNSTSFPQKEAPWRIVFHIDPCISKRSQNQEDVKLQIPMTLRPFEVKALQSNENIYADKSSQKPTEEKPLFAHLPLKLGVTALCRALQEGTATQEVYPEDEEETAEQKRVPFMLSKPRLLSSLPALPDFMTAKKEERALQGGVQTHKALGLLCIAGAREAMRSQAATQNFVSAEMERMVLQGVFTKEQAALCNRKMIAGFLRSGLGARMLASPRIMREWSFNMKITKPFDTILQGVLDLCFLENGAWVLVDFKTDHVERAEELWPRYARQLHFYREALLCATPYPVSESILFALQTGEAVSEDSGNGQIVTK